MSHLLTSKPKIKNKKSLGNLLSNPTKCGTIKSFQGEQQEREGKPKPNQKGKMPMLSLVSLNTLRTLTTDPAILSEIDAEIAKATKAADRKAEQAQAKATAYGDAKVIVINALREIGSPVSAAELFEEIEDALPEDFTKGKMVYGMTRLWTAEIVKDGSLYSLRG